MLRRVALVGCRRGQWVRTADMPALRIRAQIHEHTILCVFRKRGDDDEGRVDYITGPRTVDLDGHAVWTKVDVVDGPFNDAIVVLEGRAA